MYLVGTDPGAGGRCRFTPKAARVGNDYGHRDFASRRVALPRSIVRSDRKSQSHKTMFEKSISIALMATVVWGAFHFFGDIDPGPRAVVALAPVYAPTQIEEGIHFASGR